MSSNEPDHGGIPTRAIHEAYLDMQRALKRYRQATDRGSEAEIDRAHGDVQETVLTLYELLRPHIKHNDAVSEYWDGEPPPYPHEDGQAPDPEDGKGVLAVQNRTKSFGLSAEQREAIAEVDTLADWHDVLSLNGNVRLTGVQVNGSGGMVGFQAYELGLRKLDSWETEWRTRQTQLGGFMGSVSQTETERDRVKIGKLKRAARELGDVAERLGALSEFDASESRTEITPELIEDVNAWREQKGLNE